MPGSYDDLGKLIVRVMVGGLLWFHAYGFMRGDPGIGRTLAAWRLPAATAYLGLFTEVVGPLMMIAGVFTRLGAVAVAIFMLVAILLVHVAEIRGLPGSGLHMFKMGMNPAGTHFDKYYLETQMFYLCGAIAVALLGQGRFGLGIGGRWN